MSTKIISKLATDRSICINPRAWSNVIQNISHIENVLKTPTMPDDAEVLYIYLTKHLTLRAFNRE